MKTVVSRVDSFTSADAPVSSPTATAASPERSAKPKPARAAKAVKHLVVMKALASQARLMALELALDGSALNATDIASTMRLTARRAVDHLTILTNAGILERRAGRDKRVTEYVIRPGFVRPAENGTAIFDFGTGELYFPRVKLPVSQLAESK